MSTLNCKAWIRSVNRPRNDFGFVLLNEPTKKSFGPVLDYIEPNSNNIESANGLAKALKIQLFHHDAQLRIDWIPIDESDNATIGQHIRKFAHEALDDLELDASKKGESESREVKAKRLYRHFLMSAGAPAKRQEGKPHFMVHRLDEVMSSPNETLAKQNYEGAAEPELHQAIDRLKLVAEGIRIWKNKHGSFPDNSPVDGGTHPVSWRVKILPYLEEDALFHQYRIDEAWDSPANQELLDNMPVVFGFGKSKSNIVRLLGDTIFQNGKQPIDLATIRLNPELIFSIFVEDDKAIDWTNPTDLSLTSMERDYEKIFAQLGNVNDAENIAFLQFNGEPAYWPKRLRGTSFKTKNLVKMLLGN